MKVILSSLIVLVAVCRLVQGGEGMTVVAGDPAHAVFRLLTDFGALGAFIIYLILRERRDYAKREKDGDRWYAMDQSLMAMVEKGTVAIVESTNAICEIRKSLVENTREMRRVSTILATGKNFGRRESDGDGYPEE
ncbi:MAG: hypothetical protein LIP77_00340 [Planctomycetes bacterium]|nr:hypothetical protein [Planctomycetota bacterium]